MMFEKFNSYFKFRRLYLRFCEVWMFVYQERNADLNQVLILMVTMVTKQLRWDLTVRKSL